MKGTRIAGDVETETHHGIIMVGDRDGGENQQNVLAEVKLRLQHESKPML